MNAKIWCVIAVLASISAFAGTYDELLPFVESDGSQWIDTGINPNPKRTRMTANFRVIAPPEDIENGRFYGIYGALNKKDDKNGFEYPPGGGEFCRSFGVFLGMNNDSHRIYPALTGSTDGGYYYPDSGSYMMMVGYEVETFLATAYVNKRKSAGHYNHLRVDEELDASLYLGNVNNAGEGIYSTGPGPRVLWYRFRIWRDETLVADFIPAEKDGVAGFYDQVRQIFFGSRSSTAFLAPEKKIWTGDANGNYESEDNWEGGKRPQTARDVVTVPEGRMLNIPLSARESLNGLGGVQVAPEARAIFSGATDSGYFLLPMFGTGTVRFADSPHDRQLSFAADNLNFGGTLEVTNTYLYAVAPNCFGGTASEVHVWLDYDNYWFYFQSISAGLAKYTFHASKGFIFTSEGTAFPSPVVMDSPGELPFHANGSKAFAFDGGLRATPQTPKLNFFSGYYYMTNSAACYDLGQTRIEFQDHLEIGAPFNCENRGQRWWNYDNANLVIDSKSEKVSEGLCFGAANVLPAHTYILMNWADPLSKKSSSVINLNGFDQQMGTLAYYCNPDAGDSGPETVWNENMVIRSALPAALTLRHGAADGGEVVGGYNGVFAGRVNEAASIVLDSASETPGHIRFNCPGSTTTGSLAARRGTIEIMPTATFENLGALVASGEGRLVVNTSAVGSSANETAPYLVMTNVTGAVPPLTVGAGCSLTVETAVVGRERWLPKGVYTAATLPRWISGEGELVVRSFGGRPGLTVILR